MCIRSSLRLRLSERRLVGLVHGCRHHPRVLLGAGGGARGRRGEVGLRLHSAAATNISTVSTDAGAALPAAANEEAASIPALTWVAQRFPSWQEHGGIAILAVGLLNGFLVVTGFGITWLSTLKRYELDCKAQRLKTELARTERQLEALFGPLRAVTHATGMGFKSFVDEHRGSASEEQFDERLRTRPHSREAQRYRQLMASTLQPLNRRAMELVLSNTHLIDGEFPECLYLMYSHVIEMDSLLERWKCRDFCVAVPRTRYPCEVNRWADEEFVRLRERQRSLLQELEGKGPR